MLTKPLTKPVAKPTRKTTPRAGRIIWGSRLIIPAAKQFVIEKLMDRPDDDRIQIQTRKTRSGKERRTFGRYVADIWYEDEAGVLRNLGDAMIEERLAVRSEW